MARYNYDLAIALFIRSAIASLFLLLNSFNQKCDRLSFGEYSGFFHISNYLWDAIKETRFLGG